jgi:L-fucose isomerase-like protein
VAAVRAALPGAQRIYLALKKVVADHRLQGFTLRCFDLLTAVRNTGCLALAKLNAEGIVAGCEGDVPAALSMMVARSLLGVSGFQANPSTIDPETGEMLFAHCTIPLNMVERYEFDTHYESGIGVGIRGYMKEGPVTIFKLSGDLSRSFIAEGELLANQAKPDLCRTQQVIRLADPSQASYFLTNPIGNHHIVLPGHHRALLEEMAGQYA